MLHLLTQQHEAELAALRSDLDAQRQRDLRMLTAAKEQALAAQQEEALEQLRTLATEHDIAFQKLREEAALALAVALGGANAGHATAMQRVWIPLVA